MGDLSENFSMHEFMCPCSYNECKRGTRPTDYVSHGWPEMLKYLEALRAYLGVPIHIESGHRCPEHNSDVGGVDMSAHLRCAVDFNFRHFYGRRKYEAVQFAFNYGITGIGVAKSFIHNDRDTVKERPAVWTYQK